MRNKNSGRRVSVPKAKKKYPARYTVYDSELGRFVVPCLYKVDGTPITFNVKEVPAEMIDYERLNGEVVRICRSPATTIVWGEVIDRLAEYENKEDCEVRK